MSPSPAARSTGPASCSERFVDGSLLQESRTHDGGGSTQFKLMADGNTLLVTRVSKSPKLPKTVQYTLTYRRQP